MTTPKLPFFIPTSKLRLQPSCIHLFESYKHLYIGCTTGEIVVYLYKSQAPQEANPFDFIPKLLLIPHYSQKAGQVVDMDIVDSPMDEIFSTSSKSLITLHSDNRLRVWSLNDGRCIAISLYTLISVPLQRVITTKNGRYVLGIGNENTIYRIDVWTMKLVRMYVASVTIANSLYYGAKEKLAILDSKGQIFTWRILRENDQIVERSGERAKEEDVTREINPLSKCKLYHQEGCIGFYKVLPSDKHSIYVAVFQNIISVVSKEKAQGAKEATRILFDFKYETGPVMHSAIFKEQKVVLFSNKCCKIYSIDFIKNTIKANSTGGTFAIEPETTYNFVDFEIPQNTPHSLLQFSMYENCLLICNVKKHKICYCSLKEINVGGNNRIFDVKSVTKYALKKINSQISKRVRVNTYFKYNQYVYFKKDIFEFFIENEETSCSMIYHAPDLKTPLYILGTTKGRIFLIPMFVICSSNPMPILAIDMHYQSIVNKLYAMKGNLISTAVDGNIGITHIDGKHITKAYDNFKPNVIQLNSPKKGPIRKNSDSTFEHYTLIKYSETYLSTFIPTGVAKIMEIKSCINDEEISDEISKEYVSSFTDDNLTRECIALVAGDYSVYLYSISTLSVLYTFKGHDSDIKGIYYHESMNYLLILTKLSLYFYSLSSQTLERRTDYIYARKIFDIEEKYIADIKKDDPIRYNELLRLNNVKKDLYRIVNKIIEFPNLMDDYVIDFRNIFQYKAYTFSTDYRLRTIQGVTKEENRNTEILVKLFNRVKYLSRELHYTYKEKCDDGIAIVPLSIGVRNENIMKKAKELNVIFNGNIKESNLFHVMVVYLDDILKQIKKAVMCKIRREGIEKGEYSVEAQWPLPLLSLLYCFGVIQQQDKYLCDVYGIFPPLLHSWIGVQGVSETFSFSFPETQLENEKINIVDPSIETIKVSPYINARITLMLLSCFVQMLSIDTSDKDRERIASEIKSILSMFTGIYSSNRMVPIISLSYICKFMLYEDESISATARDLLIIPFIKKARPEGVVRLIEQLNTHLIEVIDKIMMDPNYQKAVVMLSGQELENYDFVSIFGKYVGEAEVKFLILFSYLCSKFKDLITQKGLIEPISLVILLMVAEIFNKHEKTDKSEPKRLLSTLILTFANNYELFAAGVQNSIIQTIKLFIKIYLTYAPLLKDKDKEPPKLIKINGEFFNLVKAMDINTSIKYSAQEALMSISAKQPEEFMKIMYNEIERLDLRIFHKQRLKM